MLDLIHFKMSMYSHGQTRESNIYPNTVGITGPEISLAFVLDSGIPTEVVSHRVR